MINIMLSGVKLKKSQYNQKHDNAKSKTLKVVGENVGNMLQDTHAGKGFINRSLVTQEIIQAIDKWQLPKSRASVLQQGVVKR